MNLEHFNVCTNDLLKSLSDGIELKEAAAEYIIAYENLSEIPTDYFLHKHLKITAEDIILKISLEEQAKLDAEALALQNLDNIYREGEGYLHGGHHTYGEPTNHVWSDGLTIPQESNNALGVWPYYKPNSVRNPYREIHFPFHELNHPLRRQHAETGMPHFVEVLKSHVLGGHSIKEKNFEKALMKEFRKNGFVDGFTSFDGKKTKIGGNLETPKTIHRHQHDLYERDFRRWEKENTYLFDKFTEDGYSGDEIKQMLRIAHFNDRANDWVSNEHMKTGSEFQDNIEYHPKNLGHMAYMMGLEWLTPDERSAVSQHIKEKGLDEHDEIELPNGERIPSARITYNMLMRMTPELNWAIRPQGSKGRNAHYNLEDNDKDYISGEQGKFLQQALGKIAHTPLDEFNGKSIADFILEEIENQHEAVRVKFGDNKLRFLPRLNIKNKPLEDMDWKDLQEASLNHFRKFNKDGTLGKTLSKKRDIDAVRMSYEDLMYLAGYDPKTGNLLENHPIHGKLEGPIVDKDKIDYIQNFAKTQASLESRIKDIRNVRAFFTAAHGPHPDEEIPKMWETAEDGSHTYGPGKFWNKAFQNTGGAGITLPTYLEMIHTTNTDENGEGLLFDIKNENSNYIHANELNKSLAFHFMPEIAPPTGYYSEVDKKYVYYPKTALLQNQLSPMNVSKPIVSQLGLVREGTTDKNNFTEHKSSLSPSYEYEIRNRTRTDSDRKELGTHNDQNQMHITSIPNQVQSTVSSYGANPSDIAMLNNTKIASFLNFLTGRTKHPFERVPKSIVKFKEWRRGDSGVGDEEYIDSFGNIMGWDSKVPNYNNMKNMFLKNPKDFQSLRIISNVSQLLNTTNPKAILEYIEGNDHSDLKNRLGISQNAEIGALNDLSSTFNDVIIDLKNEVENSKLTQKHKTQKKIGVNDAIQRMLMFGGALPSIQKEQEITSALDNLYNEFNLTMDPIEKEQINIQINKFEKELSKIQTRSQEKALGKPSSHWTAQENQMHDIVKSHRNLVAEVARDKIIPAILEAEPNAFSKDNPTLYVANFVRAVRDAQRYISSVPNSVHNLKAANYGFGYQEKKMKDNFHLNLANHLKEHGTLIDPNTMSVNEVLDALKIDRSANSKEHARKLLDEATKQNSPLLASSVNQILTHGNLKDIKGVNIEDLHYNEEIANKNPDELNDDESFYHVLHNEGYHKAIEEEQKTASDSDWMAHFAHSMPNRMKLLLNPQQYNFPMLAAGIGSISSDVHGVSSLKSAKRKRKRTYQTKNNLDTIVHFNPNFLEEEAGVFSPETNIVKNAGIINNTPVGAPNPSNNSIMDTFDSGAWHGGHLLEPSVGCEFTENGRIVVGNQPGPGLFYNVPDELKNTILGEGNWEDVWDNLPPVENPIPPMLSMNYDTFETTLDDPTRISMSEMSDLITSLLDPDILLNKSDDPVWSPPIRPMHRIFEKSDLQHLKGFSGSWVVSKWYDGIRVIIVRENDTITVYDENGKKKGLRKNIKEALDKINDKNYVIDGILSDENLNIIDILNYDDNNVAEMQLFERMKMLRSQFESHENVIIPGPHDTKMTDDEGLDDAIDGIKEEHENILLRDSKSTYMKGERRHPKWIIYRSSKDFNFIILDRRGKNSYTYQLGAGPIINGEELGNRGVEINGKYYMDIGTAHNQQKIFKVGDIVRASITGVTKKNRKDRPVYNIQFKEIEGEGEGEGAASIESLDLLTKSFGPLLIPHDIDITENSIDIILSDIDVVKYEYEKLEDMWVIHSPKSTIGDITKTDYPVILSESLLPFWGAIAPLMIKGYLKKEEKLDMPKLPSKEKTEEQSAGIIDRDDEDLLIKPENKKKALEIIERALDIISKEKMTWTGPKGLGIDVGTPQESPRGPTKLTDEETLPDFDGKKENKSNIKDKSKERLNHIKLQTEEGENISIDYDNEQPIVSQS